MAVKRIGGSKSWGQWKEARDSGGKLGAVEGSWGQWKEATDSEGKLGAVEGSWGSGGLIHSIGQFLNPMGH